jgi:hypothetical protein
MQLRAWLRAPGGEGTSEPELKAVLGDAAESIPDIARHRLDFAIEMLRDIFTDDAEIRAWLREPIPDLGAAPIELLRAGRVRDVEAALVRQWNQWSRTAGQRLPFRREVHHEHA